MYHVCTIETNKPLPTFLGIRGVIVYTNEFINGSDHEVVACYLELYEEGEVEHINCV